MTFPKHGVLGAISKHSQQNPHKTSLNYLENGGLEKTIKMSFYDLVSEAQQIASYLKNRYQPQTRILLLFPPGNQFVVSFLACIYARMIAVPCVLPGKRERDWDKTIGLVQDCKPEAVLTLELYQERFQAKFEQYQIETLIHEHCCQSITDTANQFSLHESCYLEQDTVFLQYTSGSTGKPKGVIVSHGNLYHQLTMLQTSLQLTSDDVLVHWLPLFHDMGLIATLCAVFSGFSCNYMAPVAFLQNPLCWPEAIAHLKGTITTAPNFSYELCVNRMDTERLVGLDLSSLKHALNGAEPVRVSTFEKFYSSFRQFGLALEALKPVYGMAEATLLITVPEYGIAPSYAYLDVHALARREAIFVDKGQDDSQAFASVGSVAGEQTLKIVNPDTKALCEQSEIGEIWVQGGSVAKGYWNNEATTKEYFNAGIHSHSRTSKYLRTGDLGFVDPEGKLYIAGRLKDTIIIRGKNFYPQDIEYAVSASHAALFGNMGAAFSVNEGDEEKLIVVHEVSRTAMKKLKPAEVITAVRKVVSERFSLQVSAILLIPPRTLPKTSSGKVQRSKCRDKFLEKSFKTLEHWFVNRDEPGVESDAVDNGLPVTLHESLTSPSAGSAKSIETLATLQQWMVKQISTLTGVPVDEVDIDESFSSFGLDSIQAVQFSTELEARLGVSISPVIAYDYPTIRKAALFLHNDQAKPSDDSDELAPSAKLDRNGDDLIAIVGMSCRFPGANSLQAYWSLLESGEDAIKPGPAKRFDNATVYGGFLNQGVDEFDAAFFGITPIEAAAMDPQQRITMEVTWEAIEHAGITLSEIKENTTGVFLGVSSFDYALALQNVNTDSTAYVGTGSSHSILANRLSYFLDSTGPSLAMDTACSSSLVALNYACQSLKSGETDLAISGGVNLLLSPYVSDIFSQANMTSTDAKCKTFDEAADGYVRGEGAGIVLLKRYQDALRDGDNIFAVISGTAVNQDGRSHGLTAPNGVAQEKVITAALNNANIAPRQVDYIEAHGTGTALGDPIELNAIARVFSQTERDSPLFVGSTKTNIGHLEAAAGIAGVIKTALSLHNQVIPAHLNFNSLNSKINLAGANIQIPTSTSAWLKDADSPRVAGVSSFGFGGTNAHVILQQHKTEHTHQDVISQGVEASKGLLLPFSAKSPEALRSKVSTFIDHLSQQDSLNWRGIAQTLSLHREHFEYRTAIALGESEPEALKSEVIEKLTNYLTKKTDNQTGFSEAKVMRNVKLAFLFSGQGAQFLGMGEQLYKQQAVFREEFDRCRAILSRDLAVDILDFILPAKEQVDSPLTALIDRTDYTQPLLFAFEYALAKLWLSFGVKPSVVFGHSIGEYVAACIAGVFDLKDGLALAAARGALMHSLPHQGAMAVIFASEREVIDQIEDCNVNIAAINGPKNTVISGHSADIESTLIRFKSKGVATEKLNVSQAFHSELLTPCLESFRKHLTEVSFHDPKLPIISGLTGELATTEQVKDPEYWCRQTLEAVRYATGVNTLVNTMAVNALIELGPKPLLINMGRRCVSAKLTKSSEAHQPLWLSSSRPNEKNNLQLYTSLGRIYALGQTLNWQAMAPPHESSISRAILPSYPFQRKSFWLEGEPRENRGAERTTASSTTMHEAQTEAINSDFVYTSILSKLVSNISEWSGIQPEQMNVDVNLFSIGIDSLVLMKLKQKVENDYGVEISMKLFYDSVDSLSKLASYIDQHLDVPHRAQLMAQLNTEPLHRVEHKERKTQSLPVPIASLQSLNGSGVTSERNTEYEASSSTGSRQSIEALLHRQYDCLAQQNKLVNQYISQFNDFTHEGTSSNESVFNNKRK